MRTDLTRMCVPCRLRLAEVADACLRCGGELDTAIEGRAKLDALPREERSAFAIVACILTLVGCSAGTLVALACEPPSVVQPVLGAIVGLVVAQWLRPRLYWTEPPRVKLGVDVRPRGGRGISVVGRVVADATLEAGISGRRCVAFRLTGRAGGDRVDDARAVPFTVVTDDGVRVRVLARPARVQVATRATEADADAPARLRLFLDARGLDPRDVRLEEGIVAAGDRVRVSGAPTEIADPAVDAGYRDAVFVPGLTDARAGELTIRRA